MERLQKVMAEAGIASRRKCEEYILAGRVVVNGIPVTALGSKVDPDKDEIRFDGKLLGKQGKLYIALHKPKGVIASIKDPKGRKVVTDFLHGIGERVYPVGRLDYDSEGLILLTNDGEFANLLMHPKHQIAKTYHVTVKGTPHGTVLDKLKSGIQLEDGMTAPAEVDYVDVDLEKNVTIVTITIYEGRNRQVRRMFEAVHFPVVRLRRVKIGHLQLAGLPRGKFRHLTRDEVKDLTDLANESHNVHNT